MVAVAGQVLPRDADGIAIIQCAGEGGGIQVQYKPLPVESHVVEQGNGAFKGIDGVAPGIDVGLAELDGGGVGPI